MHVFMCTHSCFVPHTSTIIQSHAHAQILRMCRLGVGKKSNPTQKIFITISDISLTIKIILTKIILMGIITFPLTFSYAQACSRHSRTITLQILAVKVPPERRAYWCLFSHTSGRLSLVWLHCKSRSAVFREVVFLEDEYYSGPLVLYIPTGCSGAQRYGWSFFPSSSL